MTWTSQDKADKGLKLAGLLVASFGIWEYFDKLENTQMAQRADRAILQVDKFSSENIQAAQIVLANFWSARPDFLQAATQGQLTPDNYRNLILQSIAKAPNGNEIRGAIFDINAQYANAWRCAKNDICDEELIKTALCEPSKAFVSTYGPVLSAISAQIGFHEFGGPVQEMSEQC